MSSAVQPGLVKLQRWVPARLLSRIVRTLSRCRYTLLKDLLIRSFIWIYDINIEEANQPVPSGYPDFNAFFTRTLRPGSRPVDGEDDALCSPADGSIAQIGSIQGQQLIQAKGLTYTLPQLFGGDEVHGQQFAGGSYATIYLAPYNYHRVHAPLDGVLQEMVYVPGRLLSVNERTTSVMPGLYVGNERLICHFDGASGPFSVVLVGAMNVGSISTAWAGEIVPRPPRETFRRSYPSVQDDVSLNKGDYLGQFNLGSTVILVLGPDQVQWNDEFTAGSTVRVGQCIGRICAE